MVTTDTVAMGSGDNKVTTLFITIVVIIKLVDGCVFVILVIFRSHSSDTCQLNRFSRT